MSTRRLLAYFCLAFLVHSTRRAAADAVYVPSTGSDSVVRIGANGAQSPFLSNVVDPVGVAFDASGNLYVSSSTGGTINKYPANGGAVVPLAIGLNGPTGLAVAADGTLYAAISGDNVIVKFPPGGSQTPVASVGSSANPQGIAFDQDGVLFVANKGNNTISKVTGNTATLFATSNDVTAPVAVAITAQNRVAVVHGKNGGEIIEFNANGNGKPKSVVKSLGTPTALAIDSIGDYYVGTTADKVIKVVGSTATDFATGIGGPGLLITRTAQFKLVAFKNEVLADLNNAKYATLGAPIIGGGGDVAYLGKLLAGVSGVGATNDAGIWTTDASGSRRLVAREGGTAPDSNSAIFSGFSDPVVNADGRVAFRGTLAKNVNGAAAGTLVGLWAEGTGGLGKVARQGEEPPGITGAKFVAFQQFALPDAGGLVFLATVSGGGATSATNSGLWAVDGAGVVQLVLRKGDPVNVNNVNKNIKTFTLFSKVPFSTGQTRSYATDGGLLFRATFTDGTTALLSKEFGSSTPNVVTYKNEVLTIDPMGAKLTNPVTGSVNADLSVAFRSSLSGGGVATSSNQAVFRRKADSTLEIVARKSFVPNDASDAIFSGFSDPAINDAGEVAFRATLKGTGGASVSGKAFGLWLGLPGTPDLLHLVARQGDAPPSVAGSVKFTSFGQFCAPAEGGLVFLANIDGSGITTANNQGLWQRDTTGALDVVIRKGDSLGGSSKVASITAFKALPFCGSQGRTVASDGSIALLLKFTDGNQAIYRVTLP